MEAYRAFKIVPVSRRRKTSRTGSKKWCSTLSCDPGCKQRGKDSFCESKLGCQTNRFRGWRLKIIISMTSDDLKKSGYDVSNRWTNRFKWFGWKSNIAAQKVRREDGLRSPVVGWLIPLMGYNFCDSRKILRSWWLFRKTESGRFGRLRVMRDYLLRGGNSQFIAMRVGIDTLL